MCEDDEVNPRIQIGSVRFDAIICQPNKVLVKFICPVPVGASVACCFLAVLEAELVFERHSTQRRSMQHGVIAWVAIT